MSALPTERHLLRAKDFADAHYAEPIGVRAMAEAAGLSQAHFTRAFRDLFGVTPHGYLLTRRLERAAALLRNTEHSVAEVCMEVGLSSVGSFTTSFKRMFGRTPTEYRAAHPLTPDRFPLPSCVVRAYARPQLRTFREDPAVSESIGSPATDSSSTGADT
jgi:AraC-like DNA-binding protein